MEKTNSIIIGGLAFIIEDAAYKKLEEYLASLKKHFSSFADSGEIISDIESRIAEMLSEEIKNNRRAGVNLFDVEKIISAMGEAKDISSENSAREEKNSAEEKNEEKNEDGGQEKNTGEPKRFFRSGENGIIAGVASGLAEYFGIDAIIIRLIFILLTIFGGGSGILIYIILWVITPEAKTMSEKMEMRGEPVTIKKIEENVKKTLEKNNINKDSLRNFSARLNDFLRQIFSLLIKSGKILIKIFGGFIGVIFIFIGVVAIFSICFSAAACIFSPESAYLNGPNFLEIKNIIGASWYAVSIVCAAIIAIVPVLFIFLLGIILIRRKNVFTALFTSLLISFWLAAIIIAGVAGLKFAPKIENKIEEIKNISSFEARRDFSVGEFDRVRADGLDEIIIETGKDKSVWAEGREYDLSKLKISAVNGELRLDRHNEFFNFWSQAVKIHVSLPELKNLRLDGVTKAQANGLKQADLDLKLDGAAKAIIEAEISGRLAIKMDGVSKLEIRGRAENLEADLDGAARYSGLEFISRLADFKLDGVSRGEASVSENLKAEADGASRLIYAGEAKTEIKTEGAAKVEKK